MSNVQSYQSIDVSYEIREENLLGLPLTYALFQVTVDENLYLFDSFQCTPECKEIPSGCSTCDYSFTGEKCGTLREGITTNCTSCDRNFDFCENATLNNFIHLELEDRQGPFRISEEDNIDYFRFYFDRPCHGIRIQIEEVWGEATMFFFNSELHYSYAPYVDTVICPKDAFYYFGTNYFFVWRSKTEDSEYFITIQTKHFGSSEFEIHSPEYFPNDPYNSWKLVDGQTSGPYSMKKLQFLYFKIRVETCKQFLLRRELISYENDTTGDMGIIFQQNSPGFSPDLFHINHPANFIFSVCPENNSSYSDLYLSIVNLEVGCQVLVTLTSDSSLWTKKKINEFPLVVGHEAIQGMMFELQCVDKSKKKYTWHCRKGADFWGSSCLELWAGVPTEQTSALWPRPHYFRNFDPKTFKDLPYKTKENITRSDQVIGGMLLELVAGSQIIEPYPDWRTSLETNCSIVFPIFSGIANEKGIPITGKYSARRMSSKCDDKEFIKVSTQIDQLTQQMKSQNETISILAVRYAIDMQTFSPVWQGCDSFIHGFTGTKSSMVEYSNTKGCSNEMLQNEELRENDPCCNDDLRWEMCCTERTVSLETNQLVVDQSKLSNCGDEQCLETLMNDYIFYKTLGDSLTGCSSVVKEPLRIKDYHSLEFVSYCKEKVFGEDGKGKECLTDDDCLFQCHSQERVCVYQNDQQIEQIYQIFWNCIDEEIPSLTRSFLIDLNTQENGLNRSLNFVDILNKYYVYDDCLAWLGKSNNSRGFANNAYATGFCVSCDYFCFDSSCISPIRCEQNIQYGRPMNPCTYVRFNHDLLKSRCGNIIYCNWNSSIDNEDDCISLFNSNTINIDQRKDDLKFCGVCETPSSCQQVSLSLSECEGEVCVIGGKVDESVRDKKECKEERGHCTMECDQCSTKEGCLNYGRCTDRSLIVDYLVKASYYSDDPVKEQELWRETDGYCASEMEPWNYPDCAYEGGQQSIPTPVGCVHVLHKDECLKDPSNIWIPLSKSKEECLSFQSCQEIDIPTSLTSMKDQEQCSLCEGQIKTAYIWETGQWIPGTMRNVSIVPVSWEPTERWAKTIDFIKLVDHITQSNTESYSFELQSEVQCKLNPLKTVMEKIVCLCEVEGDKSSEEVCFGEQQNLEIAIGKLCQGDSYTLIAPPSVLSFNSSSLSSGCLTLSVSTLLASEVGSPPSVSLSTSFRKKAERGDNVKNLKGVYVGKLIGNGVQLNQVSVDDNDQNEGDQRIESFELCISFEEKYQEDNYNDGTFTEYDFAERVSVSEVRPLSLPVYFSSSKSLCSMITKEHINQNIKQGELISLYPIIRKKQWEDQNTNDSLSSGEIGVYSVMLVLYLILLILKLFDDFSEGKKILNTKRWISWLLMSCIFVRVIYFIVLLSNTLPDEDTMEEFLLIEIPSYLYFLGITMAALLWYAVRHVVSSLDIPRIVLNRFIVVLCLTIIFVISIVISWELSGESESYRCGGRVSNQPDTSTQEDLRLAYRIVLSLASICVCIAISYFGGAIWITFKQNKEKTNSDSGVYQMKIYRVTIMSTISLVSQCIFFIIYSEYVEPSYEWLLILLIIEWIPLAIIFYVLQTTTNLKKKASSLSDSSTASHKIPTQSKSVAKINQISKNESL